MKRRYRKERDLKTKYRNSHPPEVLRVLNSMTPKELWEAYKPLPTQLVELREEEQLLRIQESRIALFEFLSRRFGLGSLALHGDTLHTLGLKLDYSDLLQLDPISESYY